MLLGWARLGSWSWVGVPRSARLDLKFKRDAEFKDDRRIQSLSPLFLSQPTKTRQFSTHFLKALDHLEIMNYEILVAFQLRAINLPDRAFTCALEHQRFKQTIRCRPFQEPRVFLQIKRLQQTYLPTDNKGMRLQSWSCLLSVHSR